MTDNFKDNITYGGSTLAVSGDAIVVGSTNAGAKSIIFNNTGSQGHLAWQPTANRTVTIPDTSGVIQLTGQAPGAIYDGANSISTGTIRFTNANGVSFSINGQTISGSVAAQTNQTAGLYALGNTTQNSSTTLDARSLSFNGLGNITVGYSNGSIQISGAGGGGVNINVSAGTTSNNLTNLVFSNSNGVSFGLNGSTITATVSPGAGLAAVYDGANSISTGTIRFTNANGVSFSINGQTISGSVAAQTNQTVGLYAVSNTTGASSSSTADARSLSFQGAGGVSVGYTNGSVVISGGAGGAGDGVNILAAGTQTANTTGTVVFSNSNGVTFGMSNSSIITASFNGTLGSVVFSNSNNITFGSAGNTTITASYLGVNYSAGTTSNNLGSIVFSNSNGVSFGLNGSTVTASVSLQTEGWYALGNTTGQSSSSTFDARSQSLSGVGNISVGYSGNAIIISGSGGGGVALSAGANSTSTGTVIFSNSNGISFGMSNNGVVTASVAAVAGSDVVFSNSNNIYFGKNVSTVTASIGPIYTYEPYALQDSASGLQSVGTVSSGAAYFFPFIVVAPVAAGWLNVAQSMSFITSTSNSNGSQTITASYGLYSRGTGTNNSTISAFTSGSYGISISYNSQTITINQPTSTNSTGYGTGSTTSAGVAISSGYTGGKLVQLPINSLLTPGQYWLGIFNRESSSSAHIGVSYSYIGGNIGTIMANGLAPIGSFSSAYSSGTNVTAYVGGPWHQGMGSFTSAGQTNLPGTIALSQLTNSSGTMSVIPYMKFWSTI